MIDLKGKKVFHSGFGPGEVISQNGDYLTIRFKEGEKKLSALYTINNKMLRFEDPEIMEEIRSRFGSIKDPAAIRKELKKTKEEEAEEERKRTALLKACYQTAGKIVASEVLIPGSASCARVYGSSAKKCSSFSCNTDVLSNIEKSLLYGIMVYLSGMQACRIKFVNSYAQGCAEDITSAIRLIEALNAPKKKEELFEYLRRYENACDKLLSDNRQLLEYVVDFLKDNGHINADIIKEMKNRSVIKPFYLCSIRNGGKKYA